MFAMTQMDDQQHPECELYVEDLAAKVMVGEVLAQHASDLFVRCSIVPYGAASVGQALGIMASQKRFAARARDILFIALYVVTIRLLC